MSLDLALFRVKSEIGAPLLHIVKFNLGGWRKGLYYERKVGTTHFSETSLSAAPPLRTDSSMESDDMQGQLKGNSTLVS